MHLAPNSNGILKRIGIDAEKLGAVETKFLTEYESSGKLIHSLPASDVTKIMQHVGISRSSQTAFSLSHVC